MEPDTIIAALPWLRQRLLQQTPHGLENLTQGDVQQILCAVANAYPGVYLFTLIKDNVPLYVGRTANLPVRVANDHRSVDRNLAMVTRALMDNRTLPSMQQAREALFEECEVRMLIEPDAGTRALLEIYVALSLDTQFNHIEERTFPVESRCGAVV